MSPRASLLTRARLLKWTPVVSLALLGAAMTGPLRAEDKLDKKVVELVKKSGELYKNAKTLHADVTIHAKINANGQKRVINVTGVYDFERPNRLSFKGQLNGDPKKELQVISDGKTLTIYRTEVKQYVQEDAPKEASGLGARLQQLGPLTGILFVNVLQDDPADALMQGVNSCSDAGIEKVDGTPAHHLKFSQDQFDWEMWVAAEGKPFVLRMSNTLFGKSTETYNNWKLDAPAGKDVFTFSPPKDATKVDEFKQSPEGP
jgi:hypothetical protein